MAIAELLSKPEFWSALFGALAAFFLGLLATWWAGANAERTAGNLAIITLSQMCSLMENLRRQLVIRNVRGGVWCDIQRGVQSRI